MCSTMHSQTQWCQLSWEIYSPATPSASTQPTLGDRNRKKRKDGEHIWSQYLGWRKDPCQDWTYSLVKIRSTSSSWHTFSKSSPQVVLFVALIVFGNDGFPQRLSNYSTASLQTQTPLPINLGLSSYLT